MKTLESTAKARREQHKVTRYAEIEEVNKIMQHLEERYKDGKLSFIEIQHAFNSLQNRIMNLPENGANQF